MATLAHDLHVLVSLMGRRADVLLSEGGSPLTYRRFLALTHVADLDRPSQRDIADRLGLSEAAMSRMIANLSDAGYLTTEASQGRRRAVVLTDSGAEELTRAGRLLGDSFDHAVRGAGADPAELAATINRISAIVREASS